MTTRIYLAAMALAVLIISFLLIIAALAQAPTTDAGFLTAAPQPTSPAPAAPSAVSLGWYEILSGAFYLALVTLLGWLVNLCKPLILRLADVIGQRQAVEALLHDKQMTEYTAGTIAPMALEMILKALGVDKKDLANPGVRYQVMAGANAWAAEQYPAEWKWILEGMRLNANTSPQMAQIAYLEAAVAKDLPPVVHATPPPAPPAA